MVFASVSLKITAHLSDILYANFMEGDQWSLKRMNGQFKKASSSHFSKTINVVGFITTVVCQKPYKYNPKRLSTQFIFYGTILGNFIMGA